MARDLSAEESALWRRVTASWRGEPSISSGPAVPPKRLESARALPQPSSRPAPLDASWDRALRDGVVVPDRVVDLHDCSLHVAHRRALDAIGDAVANEDRLVVLVTGKAPPADRTRIDLPLRGIIRASIGDWLAASTFARHIVAIRPAHRRHGGAGAIYVVIRRKRLSPPKLS